MTDCIFCKIVRGEAPASFFQRGDDAIVIHPLNPVVPGHLLVIPTQHVKDLAESPVVTADVMNRTACLIQDLRDGIDCAEDYNVIANVGPLAGQTVFHLHVHVVPRYKDDGLIMPWTAQQKALDLEAACLKVLQSFRKLYPDDMGASCRVETVVQALNNTTVFGQAFIDIATSRVKMCLEDMRKKGLVDGEKWWYRAKP